MEEVEQLKLEMRRNKVSASDLAKGSGCYSYAQVRRMLRGNPTIQELATLKTVLGTLV